MICGIIIKIHLIGITEKEKDERVDILQKLMDKYTFAGVDQSWLKLCYYYDYLGA